MENSMPALISRAIDQGEKAKRFPPVKALRSPKNGILPTFVEGLGNRSVTLLRMTENPAESAGAVNVTNCRLYSG